MKIASISTEDDKKRKIKRIFLPKTKDDKKATYPTKGRRFNTKRLSQQKTQNSYRFLGLRCAWYKHMHGYQ